MGISELIRRLFRREQSDFDLASKFAKGSKIDKVDNAHGRFGYSKTNPIPVDGQKGQIDYLASLRCKCNEHFAFHRVGSFGSGPDGHVVDGYEILCRKRKHNFVLYMDMYHSSQSELLPEGLTQGEPKGIGLPVYVENFPEGLADAFKALAQMEEK